MEITNSRLQKKGLHYLKMHHEIRKLLPQLLQAKMANEFDIF